MTAVGPRAALVALAVLAAAPVSAQLSGPEILSRLRAQHALARTAPGGAGAAAGAETAPVERPEPPAAVRAALPRDLPPEMPEDAQVNLRIAFGANSAFIRADQPKALGALCDALREAPRDWAFNIIGHAEAAGDDLLNLRLTEARAREVRRYLSRECGVSADRLDVYGLGETRPLGGAPLGSEDDRRVEIQVRRQR